MVSARRYEGGLAAEALLNLETENAAVKSEGAVEIGDFKMHVADADAGIDGPRR
jgi:hypothetical protein